jgi:hypothetical protein
MGFGGRQTVRVASPAEIQALKATGVIHKHSRPPILGRHSALRPALKRLNLAPEQASSVNNNRVSTLVSSHRLDTANVHITVAPSNNVECVVVQGNEQCLRVAWQTLDKQSWPKETPRNNNFKPLEGGRYGITKDDVQLKPGQPLALQLEALHHFLNPRQENLSTVPSLVASIMSSTRHHVTV